MQSKNLDHLMNIVQLVFSLYQIIFEINFRIWVIQSWFWDNTTTISITFLQI